MHKIDGPSWIDEIGNTAPTIAEETPLADAISVGDALPQAGATPAAEVDHQGTAAGSSADANSYGASIPHVDIARRDSIVSPFHAASPVKAGSQVDTALESIETN